MPLTAEQKKQNRFDRMLEKAKEFMPHNYLNRFVAPAFQKMIRAEAGAKDGLTLVWKQGTVQWVKARVGFCACVTCGKILPWSSDKKSGMEGMDTGHFVPGRRASIVLDERNVAPQCQFDNKYNHGMPEAYANWMLEAHGQDVIDDLHRLNNQVSRKFSHEELVELRIGYMARMAEAEQEIRDRAKF